MQDNAIDLTKLMEAFPNLRDLSFKDLKLHFTEVPENKLVTFHVTAIDYDRNEGDFNVIKFIEKTKLKSFFFFGDVQMNTEMPEKLSADTIENLGLYLPVGRESEFLNLFPNLVSLQTDESSLFNLKKEDFDRLKKFYVTRNEWYDFEYVKDKISPQLKKVC